MTRNIHTVTFVDGTTATRGSAHRTYTHALAYAFDRTQLQIDREAASVASEIEFFRAGLISPRNDRGQVVLGRTMTTTESAAKKKIRKETDKLSTLRAETPGIRYSVARWSMSYQAAQKAQLDHEFLVSLDENGNADLRVTA